jgi:hypothetical protein
MKHILNGLSDEEKNGILEQYGAEIKINAERFKSLMESELGNVKPLLNENYDEQKYNLLYQSVKGAGTNEDAFFKALYSIKDKNEYGRIDAIAKSKGEDIATLFKGDFSDVPSTEKFCGHLNYIGVNMPKNVCLGQLGWILPKKVQSGGVVREQHQFPTTGDNKNVPATPVTTGPASTDKVITHKINPNEYQELKKTILGYVNDGTKLTITINGGTSTIDGITNQSGSHRLILPTDGLKLITP